MVSPTYSIGSYEKWNENIKITIKFITIYTIFGKMKIRYVFTAQSSSEGFEYADYISADG